MCKQKTAYEMRISDWSSDVCSSDLDGELDHARRLSELNQQLGKYTFGKSRVLDFVSEDGEALQAALVLPADYQPGKRYPMVLWVYASDADAARNVHNFGLVGFQSFNMHMLTTRGYAVMWPDIPTHEGTPVRSEEHTSELQSLM